MTKRQKLMDEKFKRLEGIRKKAEVEYRNLTSEEITERGSFKADIERLAQEEQDAQAEEALRVQLYGPRGPTVGLTVAGNPDGSYDSPITGRGLIFQDLEGRSHEALPVTKRFFEYSGPRQFGPEDLGPGSFGKIIRAKLLGDSLGLNPAELRAMGEGVGSAGGWFVSPILSGYTIDLARNASCVMLAGGWTLPVDSAEITLVKILSDPTAYWVNEGVAITESQGTFGPIKMKMIILGALVRVSRALLEDAPNSGQVIESQLGAALGLELDRVCLLGNGTNEPKGLLNCDSVNTYSMGANGAALTNYDPFSYAVQYVFEDNGIPGAVIYAPRTAGSLDRLKEGTTLAPLMPPPSFQALKKFQTNQIPITQTKGSATTASSAFLGDFRNVVIGMRRSLSIDVGTMGKGSGATDVFASVEALIRAYMRVDVAILRENHFTWINGIL